MILGVTGNIASGKSTVAGWFAEQGAAVVSADMLAREVVAPGSSALDSLVDLFGRQILTSAGALDRKRMGSIVFNDPAARRCLESITHPAIAQLAEERLRSLEERNAGLVVYEAPLLFEAGADRRVDQVLVVMVERAVQIQRIVERDNLSPQAAEARIAAQWSQADKIMCADYVIDNSGPFEQTRHATEALFRYLSRQLDPAPPEHV